MSNDKVTEKLKTLPTKPGVYQYFDANKCGGRAVSILVDARLQSRYHLGAQEVCNVLP